MGLLVIALTKETYFIKVFRKILSENADAIKTIQLFFLKTLIYIPIKKAYGFFFKVKFWLLAQIQEHKFFVHNYQISVEFFISRLKIYSLYDMIIADLNPLQYSTLVVGWLPLIFSIINVYCA